MIDRWEFAAAFERAAAFCRRFAQSFTAEELPHELRFDLGRASASRTTGIRSSTSAGVY